MVNLRPNSGLREVTGLGWVNMQPLCCFLAAGILFCTVRRAAADEEPASRPDFLRNTELVSSSEVLRSAFEDSRRSGGGGKDRSSRPHLRLVTFLNKLDRRFSFLQVSAEAHSLYPQITGAGTTAWHPDGLGVKINALRRFVRDSVLDEDVLMFADAFDVLVFGGEHEILDRFLDIEESTNKSLVFNAEQVCFPNIGQLCNPETYPKGPFKQWRFLNSGLMVGRGYAFKRMLKDTVPDVIHGSDQAWYQDYFHNHRDVVHLDYRCELVCALWGIGDKPEDFGTAWTEDNRVFIPATGALPPLVHFVSLSHWTTWQQGRPTSLLHQVFKHLYPKASANLVDGWWIGAYLGSTHDIELYSGPGYWNAMRWWLCFHCNVLGSPHRECLYMTTGYCARCLMVVVPAIVLVVFLIFRYFLTVCCVRLTHYQRLSDSMPDLPLPGASGERNVSLQSLCRRAWFSMRIQLRPFRRKSSVAPE